MNISEILQRLSEPFDPAIVKQKKVGGSLIDYIPWYRICTFLDERAGLGNWEWSVDSITVTEKRIVLVGKLTLHGDDRTISMSATGTEELACSSYGDPSSNAEAMALRRAVSKVSASVRAMWEKGGGSLATPPRSSASPSSRAKKISIPGHQTGSGWGEPGHPSPDNGDAIASLMQESDRLMQQLGWDAQRGAAALARIFPGKRARRQLSADDLAKFNQILSREVAESVAGGGDR